MAKIRNLGHVSASWLEEIGVSTIDDLRIKGSVETYIALKRLQPRASLNLLYSLEAALLDMDWRDLPSDVKASLRRDLKSALDGYS